MKKRRINPKRCTDAHHHQNVRKRLNIKKFDATIIDKLVYIAGPMIPVAIAPTAYNVWVNEEVAGVSLITWGILSVTSFIMANYAIIHREKLLLLTYVPLFLLNISVVAGVLVIG